MSQVPLLSKSFASSPGFANFQNLVCKRKSGRKACFVFIPLVFSCFL